MVLELASKKPDDFKLDSVPLPKEEVTKKEAKELQDQVLFESENSYED